MGRISQIIFGFASFALAASYSVSTVLAEHSDVVEHTSESSGGHAEEMAMTFLFLAVLLIVAKIGGIVEKWGQPSVLGELGAGIFLAALGYFGFTMVFDIQANTIIAFLAELGAVLLLFLIGLESNLSKMIKAGPSSLVVAIVGVVLPFVLGAYVAGPMLFPEASNVAHLFIGASLVATSVGITASVFRTLGFHKSNLCRVVLGAAVFDDVLGLLVLAVVMALAQGGTVTPEFVGILILKATGFLAISILIGHYGAGYISHLFSKISTGTGMKLTVAFSFALLYAYLATLVGLAPIVGAFAAGLVLDAVHFKMFDRPAVTYSLEKIASASKNNKNKIKEIITEMNDTHVEDMIGSLSIIFVPIFFAFTGLMVDFGSLLHPQLYVSAAIVTVLAIIGKVAAGFVVKGPIKDKLIVGISMVPRGEVGLIFAAAGKASGAINDEIFSVIILVILATTFLAPPVLKKLIAK